MENFAVLMLVIALFVVFLVGAIAAIVVAAAAITQRIERNSLKEFTARLDRGEISTDEFSRLVTDHVLSQVPQLDADG